MTIEKPAPVADLARLDTGGDIPAFTRKSTGLVRQVSLFQQAIFCAASCSPLGAALVFTLFTLILFPRANIYLAMLISLGLGMFVWVTFALLSAAMPKIGGDYTINSRILSPWIGLGANLCACVSAVLAAGLWAYWVAEQGLSPVFTVIGTVTHSTTLTNWGGDFSAAHQTVVFCTALVALIVISILSALGTRIVMRTMTWLFMIAAAGYVVVMVLYLIVGHDGFVRHVDAFAGPGAYARTVAKGAGSGLYVAHKGYSASSTLGAVYYVLAIFMVTWWGTYLSAEFKGGGQRKRQLQVMVGAGLGQGTLVLIGAIIFLATVGHDFFVSSLSGNFTGQGGSTVGLAGYAYFGAIAAKTPALATILALTFLGLWLPGTYINMAMAQRAVLTWSFDGLLPKRLAEVNERTRTPIVAIGIVCVLSAGGAAWASYTTGFFTVFSLMVLLTFIPVMTVGVSAIVVRWRRAAMYRNTPAEWRVGGVEVLPIVGVGCVLVGALGVFLALHFHTQLGIKHWVVAALLPVAVIVIASAWWRLARAIRAREGVDLDLVYKAIPPD